MNRDVIGNDTLMLVIDEKKGIVSEYQKQLYEASLLGINKVLYCFVCDSDTNNKSDRINDMAEKIEMTCELLKMELLNKCFTVFDSFTGSRVVKTNDEGFLISSLVSVQYFDNYKEVHKNSLHDRARLGKVLAKGMAQKWTAVKVKK